MIDSRRVIVVIFEIDFWDAVISVLFDIGIKVVPEGLLVVEVIWYGNSLVFFLLLFTI